MNIDTTQTAKQKKSKKIDKVRERNHTYNHKQLLQLKIYIEIRKIARLRRMQKKFLRYIREMDRQERLREEQAERMNQETRENSDAEASGDDLPTGGAIGRTS